MKTETIFNSSVGDLICPNGCYISISGQQPVPLEIAQLLGFTLSFDSVINYRWIKVE